MKKIKLITHLVATMFLCNNIIGVNSYNVFANTQDNTYINCDFNDFNGTVAEQLPLSGWSVMNDVLNSNMVIGEPISGREDNGLKFITKEKGEKPLIISKNINPVLTGKIGLEASVVLGDTTHERGIFTLKSTDKGGIWATLVAFTSDGKILVNKEDKSARVDLGNYESNKIYNIKAILDNENKLIDIYINNELKAEGVKLKDKWNSIQNVRFSQKGKDGEISNMYVDDVKVYEIVKEAPVVVKSENIIANGSFEETEEAKNKVWQNMIQPKGYSTYVSKGNMKFSIDNTDAIEGKNALKIEAKGKARGAVTAPTVEVIADKEYEITANIKSKDITKAYMRIVPLDENQKQLPYETFKFSKSFSGNNEWTKINMKWKVPKEASYAKVSMFLQDGAGTVWFDDINMNPYTSENTGVSPSKDVNVSGIDINDQQVELSIKSFKELNLSITPENAVNKEVVWTSNNTDVVEVKNGVIVGINEGEAVITATTVDGNKSDSCKVTVTPYKKDIYDELRERRKDSIIGRNNDLNDTMVKSIIDAMSNKAQLIWSEMNKDQNRTCLWNDMNFEPDAKGKLDSAHINNTYNNLLLLAKAYSTEGSSLYGNQEFLKDIIDALDWMYENKYNEGITEYSNWWPWEIGAPVALNDIVVLLYNELTPMQMSNYMNTIYYFQPDPYHSGMSANAIKGPRPSVGANRVDTCKVAVVSGIITKNGTSIENGKNALSDVFDYVTTGDGFYEDGSFIQHKTIPYSGTYGNVLLNGIASVLGLLNATQWEVNDKDVENIYNSISEAYEPLLYKGMAMDMINGRAISRGGSQTHGVGHGIMNSILLLSESAPEPQKTEMKSMVKYLIGSDTYYDHFETMTNLQAYKMAKDLMEDNNIQSRGELVLHRKYAGMDRVVHRRPGYAFGISMHSNRVGNYESMNNENTKAWYTGDGMTYIYNNDLGQYMDFWPTVNPYRLPGTTESTEQREDATGQRRQDRTVSKKTWVGGTQLNGQYGITGMDFSNWNDSLNAKKSWFMFDDEIVALGTDINSSNGHMVETTIENRKLNAQGDNAITVNGQSKLNSGNGEEAMESVNWVHLQGNTENSDLAYYFPVSSSLKLIKENRAGAWKDINYTKSEELISANYFTMVKEHGVNPLGEKYEYVILPNRTVDQVDEYAKAPSIEILENNDKVQAVKEKSLNIIGANFWTDTVQKVDAITCNKKAAIMVQENNGTMKLAVSDPTQKNNGVIELEIDKHADSVMFKDANIEVVQLQPTIKIIVNVGNAKGKDLNIEFSMPSTN